MTPHVTAASLPPGRAAVPGPADLITIRSACLLGVRVTARAVLNVAEHRRRRSSGLGPVTHPALLRRLLEAPAVGPARDPAWWAENSLLPAGIVRRGDDGRTVTRLLQPPLVLDDVVVAAPRRQELRAVQQASLFAGFAARWAAVTRDALPVTVMLEAAYFGVGLLAPGSRVLLPAAEPDPQPPDEWAWLLAEKAYQRWLAENTAG